MSKNLQRRARAILSSLGLLQFARGVYRNHINRKYGSIRQFDVRVRDIPMTFSTEDAYSRGWFFPRYEGGKVHERPVSEAIIDSLNGARCFVDVGTNLGWYTVLAAKSIGDGSVIGFEMDDLNVDLLKKNVVLNDCDNIEVHHAAVSDEPGTISYQRASDTPSAVFSIASSNDDEDGAMVSVDAVTLDDFFGGREQMPDVIKIDVEGAETMVLNGMKGILSEVKPKLFVEIHPTKLPGYGSSYAEVAKILMDHGYEIFEIQEMRNLDGGNKAVRKIEEDALRKLGPDTELSVTCMVFAEVPAAA